MKGDFTRLTFDHRNHYSSVRMQQGRVQLDADWNEQRDIDEHHDQTTNGDVIGWCGAPLHEAGFSIQPQGGNLLIGAGRYYVDGILCENDADVLYTTQPDFPGAVLPPPDGPGVYVAYLDVWQRHLTALEDPDIREVALGGPDTATRTKTIWQVKWTRVGDLGASLNCLSEPPAWLAAIAPSTGQMQARAQPDETASALCIVPPGAGYQRLENQLYRVEIHRRGPLGDASFKWSRDNGSIVTAWLDQDSNNPNDLIVSSVGLDKTLSFAAGQWVELTDDRHELNGEPGTLVKLTNAAGQILTIDPDTATGLVARANFPSNPKVRRWDMLDGEIRAAIPVANDGWIRLKDGVEVRFQAGAFETGDYWLIPARTLTGDIEWPQDASSPPQPLLQLPHGIRHHYCRLALLEFDVANWRLVSDCRQLFPPTTELRSLFYVGGDGQEVMPDPTGQRVPLPQPLLVGVAAGTHRVPDAIVRFTVPPGGGSGLLQGNLTTVDIATVDGIARCDWWLDSTTPSQQVEASLLDGGLPVHVPIRFTATLRRASEVAYDASNCADLKEAGVRTVQQAIDRLCQRTPEAEPGIGIISIRTLNLDPQAPERPMLNDAVMAVGRLAEGIEIECDKSPLSKVSGGVLPKVPTSKYTDVTDRVPAKPTCIVTLDLPYPLGVERQVWGPGGGAGVVGFQPLILASTVVIAGNLITWQPTTFSEDWLRNRLFQSLERLLVTDRILAHLTIKGNFIWLEGSEETQTVYLDGEAFGRPPPATATATSPTTPTPPTTPPTTPPPTFPPPADRVDLQLPSGDGQRGGDLEMWFWLMPTEPTKPTELNIVAQPVQFGVQGIVIDSTGRGIPGACVTLTGLDDRTGVTTDEGQFDFANLRPGLYTVRAQFGDSSDETVVEVLDRLPPLVIDPMALPGRTLDEVSGIGPTFRARLEENGITHPAEVAAMEAARLAAILRISEGRANSIIDSARRLLTA